MNPTTIGPKLAKALVEAQANMTDPRLTGDNPHFRSKFVPRDEALDAVVPVLNANGIAFLQAPVGDENGYGVRTIIAHESGEALDLGVLTVKPAKNDPQGAVAAITYASRTAVMQAFGRAGDPDDDGTTASKAADSMDGLRAVLAEVMNRAKHNKTEAAVLAALDVKAWGKPALEAFTAMSETQRQAVSFLADGGERVE